MNDFIHKIILKVLLNQENIHCIQTIILTRVYSPILNYSLQFQNILLFIDNYVRNLNQFYNMLFTQL